MRVPLGARELLGVVWARRDPDDVAPDTLRDVRETWTLPPLGAHWQALIDFAASYYQRSAGEVALGALPPELRQLRAEQLARRLKRLHQKMGAAAPGEPTPSPDLPVLSADQAAALAALRAHPGGTQLLWGATGSGKTEVYLRAALDALEAGRQVLVMVPEINLTPQQFTRFAERFPGRRVVAMHSGLTPAQRLQHWLAAHLGLADMVIGTRMAVFASLPRLGLIVVDEEHDASYKQQEGARYSARDLAVMRGHLEKVPVVLGSATPSLETWHNALPVADSGAARYQRLDLPERIGGGAMPAVRVVDWGRVKDQHGMQALRGFGAISPPLLDALRERQSRGEQSLVLLNRRGYAPVLHCAACGWKSACRHCSAWRVFHKLDRTLRCHHCGDTERVPRACPDCGNVDIEPMGRGTERVEEQLSTLLPGARVARIDADTTRRKGELEAQLASVHAGEVDVLVGTQMIAKGHDFRRITLVAAVNPDSALFSSDFRAPERLFSLLMQAAGRAGRDADVAARSEMWVQTWHPQHALYQALCTHDYPRFARAQLDERRMAGLPPFAHLALLRAEARTQEAAQAFLIAAAECGHRVADTQALTIYPVVPTPVQRVADVERAQMLVESASRAGMQRTLAAWLPELQQLRRAHRGVLRWAVDVDPLAI